MSQNPFLDFRMAMRRFIKDVQSAGGEVLAWPLHDPEFQIIQAYQEGSYAVLVGIDGQGRDGTVVMPLSQLSIQMCELPKQDADVAPDKRAFIGFLEPSRDQE